MMAFSAARLAAYFFASFSRLASRLTMEVFAICLFLSVAEREAEGLEQGLGFLVGAGGGGDRDVHAAQRVHLVEVDLREDDLLLDAHVVVAAPVKRTTGHATDVGNAGQQAVDRPVEE